MWKPEHRIAADRSGLRYPNDLTRAECNPGPANGINGPAARLVRELKAWRLRLTGERNVAGRRRKNEEAETKVGAGAPPGLSLRRRVGCAHGLHGSGRVSAFGVWFPPGPRRTPLPARHPPRQVNMATAR